ncbi:GerAB/ArcD/ProY family transporter [Feifania hominis]|uniref:GerAB/ArcD/ProY family transporter n=1 Tax=Feifania hominis TaxID=2763660 RepID=A0A926DBC7_9FIRM|nr:GerAB/ArcD/ProY family transporter [Feifania hominis]MBC8535403.1 GerAB/ArcD/ProY family transporter [Feifania hominis]
MKRSHFALTPLQLYIVGFTLVISGTVILTNALKITLFPFFAILIGTVFALPVGFLLGAAGSITGGRPLREALTLAVGKPIAVTISVFVSLFSLVAAAGLLQFMTGLVNLLSVVSFPSFITIASVLLVAGYGVHCGFDALGRFSLFGVPLLLAGLVLLNILSSSQFDFRYLLPMVPDWSSLFDGAAVTLLIPFTLPILLINLTGSFPKGKKSTKPLVLSFATGGVFLALVALRDVLVLGSPTVSAAAYPTIAALSVLRIDSVLERIDAIICAAYFIFMMVALIACLCSAVEGFASLTPRIRRPVWTWGLCAVLFVLLFWVRPAPLLNLSVILHLRYLLLAVFLLIPAACFGCLFYGRRKGRL